MCLVKVDITVYIEAAISESFDTVTAIRFNFGYRKIEMFECRFSSTEYSLP